MSLLNRLREKMRNRKAGVGQYLREPQPHSKEYLEHAWKELEEVKQQMRNPKPKPFVSPETYDPVPTSALWKGEEYWGHPDGTEIVDDLIGYFSGCRDQSLWLSFILGCNYDIDHSLTVVRWMLEQPDCDAVNALAAFEALQGDHLCGMPASEVSPSYNDSLSALKVIEAREIGNKPFATMLGPWEQELPYLDRQQILMKARSQAAGLKSSEKPALLIPEETLRSAGTGKLSIVRYHVDECTVYVVPKRGIAKPHA